MTQLKIDGYSFGKMIVAGQRFTSDLIIYPDGRIQEDWQRSQGHLLLPGDIRTVLDAAPAKVVIGTGTSGLVRVSESVMEECRKCKIELQACPTPEAVDQFNAAAEAGTVVAGCFQLTR